MLDDLDLPLGNKYQIMGIYKTNEIQYLLKSFNFSMLNITKSILIAGISLLCPLTATANPIELLKPNTFVSGSTNSTDVKSYGNWEGTYHNTGVNLMSAVQTDDGLKLRVKRMIQPGSDTVKKIANVLTLGLFNLSDGRAIRATWMSINCKDKTFNVTGDGYSWQDVYKDQYGQAEDLYYNFCIPSSAQGKAKFLNLPLISPETVAAAEVGQ